MSDENVRLMFVPEKSVRFCSCNLKDACAHCVLQRGRHALQLAAGNGEESRDMAIWLWLKIIAPIWAGEILSLFLWVRWYPSDGQVIWYGHPVHSSRSQHSDCEMLCLSASTGLKSCHSDLIHCVRTLPGSLGTRV